MSKALRSNKRLATFSLLLLSICLNAPALAQQQPTRGLSIQATAKTDAHTVGPQTFHALVIGINDYQNLNKLKTAVSDAKEVAALLEGRFGFKVKLLTNATRQQILSELNNYRRDLDENASLLIYYAGHGYNDSEVDKAYWLPVDARADDNSNWISADDITTNTKGIHARHVLIVSDSCYSGTIVRDADVTLSNPTEHDRYITKMVEGKSRTLMASGGNEPVADGGGSGHSIFANALLGGITRMGGDRFTAGELFRDHIVESVAGSAEQTPEYSPLRNSGHESGDFVFVRLGGASPQTQPGADASPAATPAQIAGSQRTLQADATQAALPDNLTADQYGQIGDAAINAHHWAEAERAYRAALRLQPKRAIFHSSLSLALQNQQRYTEAEAEAREALKLFESSGRAAQYLGETSLLHSRLAFTLGKQEKFTEAEVERREAVRLQPDNPQLHANLATNLLNQKKFQEAQTEAETVVRFAPGDARSHNILGLALRAQNKYTEAVAEFGKAVQLDKSNNVEFKINLDQTIARQKATH